MLGILVRRLCEEGYAVSFQYGPGKLVTATISKEVGFGDVLLKSASSMTCLNAVYDVLEAIGKPEWLSDAGRLLALGKRNSRSGKQLEASKSNGHKGGRPTGSKDKHPRKRRRT